MSLFELLLYSAIPFTEQRVTIPLGIIIYDHDPVMTTILCFVGALIPAPFILIFFKQAYEFAGRFKIVSPLISFIDNKVRKKSGRFELYKEIALITFVGIPLPGTGVWTGSVIASLLGLDFKKSIVCIIIGNLLSALILLGLSLLFPAVLGTIQKI